MATLLAKDLRAFLDFLYQPRQPGDPDRLLWRKGIWTLVNCYVPDNDRPTETDDYYVGEL